MSAPAAPQPHGPRFGAHDAARVRFRRAVTLLLMTLVLPGSAQLVAGSRRVGRLAIRVWVCWGRWPSWSWSACSGIVWHLVSSTFMLGFLRMLLAAFAVGWALLFFDAWRSASRSSCCRSSGSRSSASTAWRLVAGSLLFASHMVAVQRTFIATMFGDGEATEATHGRYNVLLLGDSGADRARGCDPTASRSRASTRRPAGPSCSASRAT